MEGGGLTLSRSPMTAIPNPSPNHQTRWKDYIKTEGNDVEALLAHSLSQQLGTSDQSSSSPLANHRYTRLRADSLSSAISSSQLAGSGRGIPDFVGGHIDVRGRKISGCSSAGGSSTATAMTDLYYPAAVNSRSAFSHSTLPRAPPTAAGRSPTFGTASSVKVAMWQQQQQRRQQILQQQQSATGLHNSAVDFSNGSTPPGSSSCLNCGHHNEIIDHNHAHSMPPSPSNGRPPSHPSFAAGQWTPSPASHVQHHMNPGPSDDVVLPLRRMSFSQSSQQLLFPNGSIAELESRYNAMKNLNSLLPSAVNGHQTEEFPPPPPAAGGQSCQAADNIHPADDDAVSLVGSCFDIPPPPAPVLSHAVLESGLGHELPPAGPRTPGPMRRINTVAAGGFNPKEWPSMKTSCSSMGIPHDRFHSMSPPNMPLPPLPPKRTSSRLSDIMAMNGSAHHGVSVRPGNLNLSGDSDTSIYSKPRPFMHRSSLMSTGSSDSSSGSSTSAADMLPPLSPLSPTSGEHVFAWPTFNLTSSSLDRDREQVMAKRSHSQLSGGELASPSAADANGNSANTSMTSQSGVYVKMHPLFAPDCPDSPYMNLLYSAVQQQGGVGSVETAMSPYLSMTGFDGQLKKFNCVSPIHHQNSGTMMGHNLPSSLGGSLGHALRQNSPPADSVSAIYAQIGSQGSGSHGDSNEHLNRSPLGSENGYQRIGVRESSVESTSTLKSSSVRTVAMVEFRELMLEVEKKRLFRVGLNLFNSHPDIGLDYLVKNGFLELSPQAVAKFFFTNHGLSRAKVGEYLCQLQNIFCMKVLSCYVDQFDFSGLRVDKALRELLLHIKVPGEAQKIEKVMEVFGKRYLKSNPSFANKLRNNDSIVTLAFAIMLLNTDLYTPSLKPEKRMGEKDFVNNLKGVDGGSDFDSKLLKNIYKSVKKSAFQTGGDHVAQTQLLQASLVQGSGNNNNKSASGQLPQLAESHRRLVCLCRLAEVQDIHTKNASEADAHARDIWLFNDIMLVTKVSATTGGGHNKTGPVYAYRDSFPLLGTEVILFATPVYKYGIQISRKADGAVLATLNAASNQDRYKFVMDLQESIFEMVIMERALKEANLIK